MKKVKKIVLVFENCDGATLTPKMFRYLCIDEITTEYMINCFQYEDGEVSEYIKCKYFFIEINKNGLKSKTGFNSDGTLKDRLLAHKDITHIHIFFNNGDDEYITVPWKGDDWTNKLQKHKVIDNELSITIKK